MISNKFYTNDTYKTAHLAQVILYQNYNRINVSLTYATYKNVFVREKYFNKVSEVTFRIFQCWIENVSSQQAINIKLSKTGFILDG